MAVERYKDFVFVPADLAEDVDLEPDRRKEILFLHGHLADWSHWQVLGIPWNASADAARSAYVDKVKVFHPDRYAGRRLGSYHARIEAVFRRLTEAKDVLTDEARRAEYVRRSAPPEELAKLEARKIQDEMRSQERRARLARTNPLVQRAGRISELVKRGKQAMEVGKNAQAANDLLTAASLDPRNAEARALAEQAKRLAGIDRAREAFDRGLGAEAVANGPVALACFLEAVAGDPGNPRYPVQAARVALRVGDRTTARQLAETAVRAAARYAPAHEMLGEVLAAEGLAREAKRAFEKALELEPGNEAARAQLKKLRWNVFG